MGGRTFGVGIIGAGRISGAHARAARESGATRLVMASEVDPARADAFEAKWSCPVVADYREVFDNPEVEIVSLTLPHWLHEPIGVAAAEAGKHIFVEKPMADTVEECDRMIAAARANGVKLFTGHTEQFLAANVAARNLIASGEVGSPVLATDCWYKAFGVASRPPWFLDRSKGGGMWLMNGAHMVDRLTYLMGQRVVAVKALVQTRFHQIAADDTALAYLQFADGTAATIAHTGYKDHPGAGVDHIGGEIMITCTEAQLKIVDRARLYRSVAGEKGGVWREIEVERVDTTTAELRALVNNIIDDEPETVSVQQARHIVAVMLACEESSRTGREVLVQE
jgi:predicted dehydrogenase